MSSKETMRTLLLNGSCPILPLVVSQRSRRKLPGFILETGRRGESLSQDRAQMWPCLSCRSRKGALTRCGLPAAAPLFASDALND